MLLIYWLPLPSDGIGGRIGCSVGLWVALARHNSVVASAHVFNCGCLAMTIGRLGTSGTGIVFVETKAMGPALKDLGAIIGSGHARCGNVSRGAGVGAEPAGNVAAALALWNPAWLVVRY